MTDKLSPHDRGSINIFKPTHLHSEDKTAVLLNQYLIAEKYAAVSQLFENKVVADLGCGNHGETIEFLQNYAPKQIYGVDLETDQLKAMLARRNIRQDNLELYDSSIESIPMIQDGLCDFVWCTGVLHHVENSENAIAEIARILKPGGAAYIMVLGVNNLLGDFVFNFMAEKIKANAFWSSWLRGQPDDVVGSIKDWIERYLMVVKKELPANRFQELAPIMNFVAANIDAKFVQTMQDRLLSPKYERKSKAEWVEEFRNHGMSLEKDISHIDETFVYNNIRDFISPLYLKDNDICRLLFGEGSSFLMLFRKNCSD